MPLVPNSPRAPSRRVPIPTTPTKSRPPRRVAAPETIQHTPRRTPTTPQLNRSSMTPKRAPQRPHPNVPRNNSSSTPAIRSPKRAATRRTGTGIVKRQPNVTFTTSKGQAPPSNDTKKNAALQAKHRSAQQKLDAHRSNPGLTPPEPCTQEYAKRTDGRSILQSKKNKTRPTPGRFDLPRSALDVDNTVPSLSPNKPSESRHERTEPSPKIVINEAMTESKLRLLQSSPLNRLIPEKDRKAAAAEVAAQKTEFASKHGIRHSGLSSSDQFIPLDPTNPSTTRGDAVNDSELEAVRKREARKMRKKVRQMRKRGVLPDEDIKDDSKQSGVVYLGHIPHGFYEKEMRSYFSQFGEVTRLRLSRSKKTGRSRGFAFLEFADGDVASIAAEAMDGYLMHGQALVAKVVPEEEVHPDTFKGAGRVFRKIPWSSIERRKMITRAKDPLKLATRSRRVKKKTKERIKSLSKKGIKYDFPELST